MAIDSHRSVIVQDRESEDFPVKFLLTLPEPEELDNTSHCKRHAMSILSICDIECRSAALHFARQEREVHVVRSHEVRSIRKFANKGLEPVELILCEGLSPESHRIVGLRTLTSDRDGIVPAFISTFDQALKVRGTVCSQSFRRRNDQLRNIPDDSSLVSVLYLPTG